MTVTVRLRTMMSRSRRMISSLNLWSVRTLALVIVNSREQKPLFQSILVGDDLKNLDIRTGDGN